MRDNTRAVTLLCLVTGVAYLVRTDIAVAQERMAPALGLSMTDMGAITAWAFQLTYALWQVPAGMLGERFGARTVLALSLLGCSAASITTGLMPERGATFTLVATRILLGVSQAAVFPVAAMAVAQYIDRAHRVRANAFCIAISSLGAAIAPLMMARAPIIGAIADGLGRRIGDTRARRRVAMSCLFGAAAFALTGAIVPGALLAIGALSLSSACLNGAESPFFTTATVIGAANPGASAGLLNLMGNLGGVLSIWLVPHMSDAWGWNGTLLFWALVASVAALLWLGVHERDAAMQPVTA